MAQIVNVDGAILSKSVTNQVKYIQESKEILIPDLDSVINLLLTKRENIGESSDVLLDHIQNLTFIKSILCDIANTNQDG